MSNKKILLNELYGLPNDRSTISRREKLWLESNRCRSCGHIMTLDSHKSNSLTIQHNSPKYYEGYSGDTTIWCYDCNQKDANWKFSHNILSIQECIRKTIGGNHKKLNGTFVVDGWVYFLQNGKIVSKKILYEWKLNLLKKWFNDYLQKIIKGKKVTSFDEYVETFIDGWYSLKHYHMGGGWYAYKQNPKLVEHWKYKSVEELQEEKEETFIFSCLINNYF
jgi:hypothetical protein